MPYDTTADGHCPVCTRVPDGRVPEHIFDNHDAAEVIDGEEPTDND